MAKCGREYGESADGEGGGGEEPNGPGKKGTKRSVAVESHGLPRSIVLDGANRHGSKLLEEIHQESERISLSRHSGKAGLRLFAQRYCGLELEGEVLEAPRPLGGGGLTIIRTGLCGSGPRLRLYAELKLGGRDFALERRGDSPGPCCSPAAWTR